MVVIGRSGRPKIKGLFVTNRDFFSTTKPLFHPRLHSSLCHPRSRKEGRKGKGLIVLYRDPLSSLLPLLCTVSQRLFGYEEKSDVTTVVLGSTFSTHLTYGPSVLVSVGLYRIDTVSSSLGPPTTVEIVIRGIYLLVSGLVVRRETSEVWCILLLFEFRHFNPKGV